MESNANEVDYVSPLFLWVSPVESRANPKRKYQNPKSRKIVVGVNPLTRAKSALCKRMSGAVGVQVHRNRGNRGCVKGKRRCLPTASRHLFIDFVVREAEDACIWLRSAGFPQYVQKFEGESAIARHRASPLYV